MLRTILCGFNFDLKDQNQPYDSVRYGLRRNNAQVQVPSIEKSLKKRSCEKESFDVFSTSEVGLSYMACSERIEPSNSLEMRRFEFSDPMHPSLQPFQQLIILTNN